MVINQKDRKSYQFVVRVSLVDLSEIYGGCINENKSKSIISVNIILAIVILFILPIMMAILLASQPEDFSGALLILISILFAISIETIFIYSFLSVLEHEHTIEWEPSPNKLFQPQDKDKKRFTPKPIPKSVKAVKVRKELLEKLEDPLLVVRTEDSAIAELHHDLLSISKELDLASFEVSKWLTWFVKQTEDYNEGKIADSLFINMLQNYYKQVEKLNSSHED